MITNRAWRDADYAALSQFLAVQAASGLPDPPMLLPGDLAWRLPGSQPEKNLRLFFSDSELTAFAWFEPLTGFEFDVRDEATDRAELMQQILDWTGEIRRSLPAGYPRFVDITDMTAWRQEITAPKQTSKEEGYYLTTVCPESDQERIRWLEGQGFHSTAHFSPVYLWDLRECLPAPEPPTGCRLRSVTEADTSERIAVHRAAWEGSQFDEARYAEIRSRSSYREELDIVLEEAGTFGSNCICWADQVSRIGHFEPVGTRSDWRGRGAARAVILEGLRRLQAADMRWARVSTAGFNAPAQALYESCGFKQVGIERTYMKKL
jgi:ribosomal protein S18 acetylase RimI-like enzyme